MTGKDNALCSEVSCGHCGDPPSRHEGGVHTLWLELSLWGSITD